MTRTLQLVLQDAEDLRSVDNFDGFKVKERGTFGNSRWSSNDYVVFTKEGEPGFWRWGFESPLTENQDPPTLYPGDLVAIEVFPRSKTITVFEPEPEQAS